MPLYADTFELCQAGDTATLYSMIHAVTEDQECSIQLPQAAIAPGCFDVGCGVSGQDVGPIQVSTGRGIDSVASAAACQELCAQVCSASLLLPLLLINLAADV